VITANVMAVVWFSTLAKSLDAVLDLVRALAILVVFPVTPGVAGPRSPERHTPSNRFNRSRIS